MLYTKKLLVTYLKGPVFFMSKQEGAEGNNSKILFCILTAAKGLNLSKPSRKHNIKVLEVDDGDDDDDDDDDELFCAIAD